VRFDRDLIFLLVAHHDHYVLEVFVEDNGPGLFSNSLERAVHCSSAADQFNEADFVFNELAVRFASLAGEYAVPDTLDRFDYTFQICEICNLRDFLFRKVGLLTSTDGIVNRHGEGDSLVFLRFGFIVVDDPEEVWVKEINEMLSIVLVSFDLFTGVLGHCVSNLLLEFKVIYLRS